MVSKELIRELHVAIKRKDVREVRASIRRYAAQAKEVINAVDDYDGETALTLAASSGTSTIAGMLLQHGAEINGHNIGHMTALHCAAEAEDAIMVDFLIVHGADTTLKDPRGMPPLDFCYNNGYHSEVLHKESPAACFVRHGAKVNLYQAIQLGLTDETEKQVKDPKAAIAGVPPKLAKALVNSFLSYLLLLCSESCWHYYGNDCLTPPEIRAKIMHSLLVAKRPLMEKIAGVGVPQTLYWGLMARLLEQGDVEVLEVCIELGLRADLSEPEPYGESECRKWASHSAKGTDLLRKLGFPL